MRAPPGGSLPCKGTWRLDKPLLFNGFWPSADSPPATEVWFRCAPPHVASLINGVDDHKAVIERRRSRSVFPRSGTSVDGGERPIDQKPSRCDGLIRNHKISSRKEPPVAKAVAKGTNVALRDASNVAKRYAALLHSHPGTTLHAYL